MEILGIIDPRIRKGDLMIINKSWKTTMPSLVEDISKSVIQKRLAAALKKYNPMQHWENTDLNLDTCQMEKNSKETYGDLGSSRSFSN